MTDTKMLQAILDRQTAISEQVKKFEEKFDNGFKGVNKRFDATDKRIDILGLQLARLEDDAPTIEEFDNLEKRVSKLETQVIKN